MTDDERWRVVGQLEAAVDSLRAQETRIRTELTAIREKIDKPKPLLERISGFLALIAVAFSLLKFPAEFLDAYVTRTATELSADDQIVFSYDVDNQVLEVRWKLDIQNDGNKQERLQISDARIVIPSPAPNAVPMDVFLFDLKSSGFRDVSSENTSRVATRIFVNEKAQESVYAVFRRRATKQEIGQMTDRGQSRRCIRVRLDGRDSPQPVPERCFDLVPSDGATIARGEEFDITFDTSTS